MNLGRINENVPMLGEDSEHKVTESRKCPECRGTGVVLSRFEYNEYTECMRCWGDGEL